MIFHANTKHERAAVTLLMSGKIYFNTRGITRNKERYLIIRKGSIFQDDTSIINVCVPNNKALKVHEANRELEGEIDN